MNIKIIVMGLVLASGAASAADWDTETKIEESIYQGFHAVDILQTIEIGKNPCFYEKEIDYAIGKHPKAGAVIAYMGTEAVLHAVVTNLFVAYAAPNWVIRTWEAVSITESANNVTKNYLIGVRMHF